MSTGSSVTTGASARVVTRFAPSPTGHLHIGGARSALFCWAFARRRGGRFMIRIEDTDAARSSDESARGILDDLAWLGIHWDDGPEHALPDGRVLGAGSRAVGPFFQARRVETYNAHVDWLLEAGRAYPAFDTPAELEAMRREAVAAKRTFKYPRPADFKLGVAPVARIARARAGEPHVVRFAMDADGVSVMDEVLGEVKIAPGEVDDFVIRKADGLPTYHFAVVIDDELMGVTHVMRAQEHLSNTPRHVALQRALRRVEPGPGGGVGEPFRTPVYAHMPLIFNNDGSKMSKRDKAKAARAALKAAMAKDPALTPAALAARTGGACAQAELAAFVAGDSDKVETAEAVAGVLGLSLPEIEVWDFRRAGYLPEAITNFVALLGWSPGTKDASGRDVEKFDLGFLAANFSIERIGRTNAKFDRVKLLSFNADAIAALSEAEFVARARAWSDEHHPGLLEGLSGEQLVLLAGAIKGRCKTLRDVAGHLAVFRAADDGLSFEAKAVEKALLKPDERGARGLEHLAAARAALGALAVFDDRVQATIDAVAASRGVQTGAVAQALRVAVTGTGVSPPIDLVLRVLGRERSLTRLDRCLRTHGA